MLHRKAILAPAAVALQKKSERIYEVSGISTGSFDEAAVRAVTLAVASHESVCIDTIVMGAIVERIDVTAALSVDVQEQRL
jgi:hypothetical protein